MAITISTRPREFYYNTDDSPSVAVYSNWNAVWNPLVYTFNVLTADIESSLLIRIYEVGTNTLLASQTRRPFKAGLWDVDLSPSLKGYLFSAYSADFTVDNNTDAGNALTFYITYTQLFDNGDDQIFNSEQTKPIVACCSAKQFNDTYGSNMAQYVPFGNELTEDKKMKFLTSFENPVMWIGYPISLSFIYSTNLIGVEVIKTEVEENINGGTLLSTDTTLDPNRIGKVNYLKIGTPSQTNTKQVTVSLKTGATISNYYVEDGYVDDGYAQIN